MKKYLLTGFITLLPLALTLIIALWLFDLFTSPLAGIIETTILNYEKNAGLSPEHHATLVYFLSRVASLILLIVIIFLLGFCGQRFLSYVFVKFPDKVFARIPFIGSIFRVSRDMTKTIFSEETKTFQQTILLPFPHQDALCMGFITGDTPPLFQKGPIQTDFVVFVPTAPHPISGYVLLVPKKLVHPVDISVEDAFKFLISCGVIDPDNKK